MKTFAEVDGAWQELLPSSESRSDSNRAIQSTIVNLPNSDESSPTSTVTTENSKQVYSRIKPQATLQKQMSWTASARPNNADATQLTLTSVQKFAMKQTKIFPGRIRKRVVLKNGMVNLSKERVEKRHQRYLQDTFTTMVDIQVRYIKWYHMVVDCI